MFSEAHRQKSTKTMRFRATLRAFGRICLGGCKGEFGMTGALALY
jgi:hypothetical protein